MSRLFGWSLPPGCSMRDIDQAYGVEGPLDCPVCVDGVELAGVDCPKCGNVTCAKHGCVVCLDLEKQRKYCSGMCGDYIHADMPKIEDEQKRVFCSEQCRKLAAMPEDF